MPSFSVSSGMLAYHLKYVPALYVLQKARLRLTVGRVIVIDV